jgi:acyl-CoA synthetase (AMP-forming)/AMP-acid ligase II
VTAKLSRIRKTEETMNIDRRQLALPVLAIGLLGVVPAFSASAEEDAALAACNAAEIVKAFIVPKQGHEPSAALAADIQSFVRKRLSAHEYPREVAFIDAMPMTTTGKVIRRLLRQQA